MGDIQRVAFKSDIVERHFAPMPLQIKSNIYIYIHLYLSIYIYVYMGRGGVGFPNFQIDQNAAGPHAVRRGVPHFDRFENWGGAVII